MPKEKLAPAKDYSNRPIDKWTTASFQAYLKDKCFELFKVTYVPFKGYGAEGKMIKSMIDNYGSEFVKKFIDETFSEYKPTSDYPGTSFGFMYSYRKNVIQRIENEKLKKQKTEAVRKKVETQIEKVDLEWI